MQHVKALISQSSSLSVESGPHYIRVNLTCSELFSLAFSISAELKVSVFAPVGSPGVLDNPILLATALGARAIADDCHCVIHFHGGVAACAVSLPQYSADIGVEAVEV